MTRSKTIALFDVDGTLSDPRKAATSDMLAFLQELKKVGDLSSTDDSSDRLPPTSLSMI